VDKSVWKLWSDGSAFNDVNANVYPIDFVIGTGQGFIAGYDTGGFKVTTDGATGLTINSGVYYCRTTNTTMANDNNRHTAVRIYAPNAVTLDLHPFSSALSETGYSFVYLDDAGAVYEATGMDWSGAVSSVSEKVLLAKIIRDGNNTVTQSDIIDERITIQKPIIDEILFNERVDTPKSEDGRMYHNNNELFFYSSHPSKMWRSLSHQIIKWKKVYQGNGQSTNSTSYVDVNGLTLTMTAPRDCTAIAFFFGAAGIENAVGVRQSVIIVIDGDNSENVVIQKSGSNNYYYPLSNIHIRDVSSGSFDVKVQHKTDNASYNTLTVGTLFVFLVEKIEETT